MEARINNVCRDGKTYSKMSRSVFEMQRPTNIEKIIKLGKKCILLVVPIGTFALGTWQVQRLNWKLNLINDLKQRTTSEPQELPTELEKLQSMEYCPVQVRGHYLYDQEILLGPRSLIIDGSFTSDIYTGFMAANAQSTVGYYVVTPFKLADRDVTILVNRGWVPTKSERKRPTENVSADVEITGIVRLNERPTSQKNYQKGKQWMYRDVDELARATGSDPVFLDLIYSDVKPGEPIPGQTRLNLRNDHLTYAITWYGLSAGTLFLWFQRFVRGVAF